MPDEEGGSHPGPGWEQLRVLIAHTPRAPALLNVLRGASGLMVQAADTVAGDPDVLIGYLFPPGSLAALRNLRWLHLTGTGTDHLPRAGLAPEVLVTTSASVPAVAVAEYAISGLLLLAKDLVPVAAGQRPEWFNSAATLLTGSRVAVVGAGRIGKAVLARLGALGARTVAVTREGAPPVPEASRTIGTDRLTAEAPAVDHLVACLPHAPGTTGLISADVLAALPWHATIVNVGRATTIDVGALYAALRAGRFRGAFLDVHETEPLPPDDPAWRVPRLVISPHRAFCFPEEAARIADCFLANLDDLRHGKSPRDLTPWPA